MSIVRNLIDVLTEIKRMADNLARDGTIEFTEHMLEGLDLVIEFVQAGGSAEDLSSEQLAKVRVVVDTIALAAASTAIVFVVGPTGAVAAATGAGILLLGIAADQAVSYVIGAIGITLVPDHIDYSSYNTPEFIKGTNSLISGDVILSTAYGDTIEAYGGHDSIANQGGSDTIFGGLGQDTLDYSAMTFASTAGIILDASVGDGSFVVHHHSDTDVVTEVEHIIGTAGTDAFVLGNYGANISGGGHIETIDAGAGDDVALLLNEGGAGPHRVAIDGGSGIDTIVIADDGFNTEIDFDAGTLRYQGGVNAQFTVANFEAAQGGDGSDVMLGSDRAEYLLGNDGADRLFGGGADDFIFFDFADGANVNGGAGRDVGVALGSEGVTVDMAAQGLECVIGCDGTDTITVSNENDPVFAAGGGGSDHFILDIFEAYGPRILWGGTGADVFEFQNAGRVSLAVVNIDALTEEAFSRLTIADLGLGEIDVSLLSAIIINPDATDRFYSDEGVLGTSSVDLRDWWQIGDDPDLLDLLVPGFASPVSLDIRTSDVLGGSYSVQGVFRNEVRAIHEITIQYNYHDVTVRSDGGYDVVNTDTYEEYLIRWNEEAGRMLTGSDEIIEDALRSAERVFAQWDEYDYGDITSEYWTVQARSDIPTGPFYVVGGEFVGNVLSANGELSGSLAGDPGPSPFDWLLAA